jgi:toxin ParE1/3/4
MKILWSDLAKVQLREICNYYREVATAKVALSIRNKIYQKTRKLARFPELGQRENNPLVASLDYRYLVSGNYKIVYKIFREQGTVVIAAIFDTRQDPNDLRV